MTAATLLTMVALLGAIGGWAGDGPLTLTPETLALGEIDGATVLTREVVAVAPAGAEVTRAISSCPCVTVSTSMELPAKLAAGGCFTLTVRIDPSSYAGTFGKTVFVQARGLDEAASRLIRLPIEGRIREADVPPTAAAPPAAVSEPQNQRMDVRAYEASMAAEELRRGLVLFLSPTCDRCNWVKLIWLPRFRKLHPQTPVVVANVTEQEGLALLLEMEKQTGTEPGHEAPAAWYQGKLVYGTEAIGKLLPEEE